MDDIVIDTMNTMFLDKELTPVNKKILFGIMSKKVEKHILADLKVLPNDGS